MEGDLLMETNFYDKKYYGKFNTFGKVQRRAPVKSAEQKFLENLFNPESGKRLLDIGCGTGIILGMLEDRGIDLWGIDISRNATEIAKKRVSKPGQVICANADPLPFSNDEFDYIIAWGVVEHFPSIQRILGEIKRILKKDGKAIIMVPNVYYYKFIWDTLRKGSGPVKLQEIETLYSFKEWKDLIESTGLIVQETARHNKFDKPRLKWLRNLLIPYYFSHHFVYVCTK